ncbi:transcriptional regulator, partial [Lactococcus lactis]
LRLQNDIDLRNTIDHKGEEYRKIKQYQTN